MAFQFKIQISNITYPPVWRRVLAPERFSFLQMHSLIQISFGWENSHLFQFSPKGYGSWPQIGIPMEDDDLLFAGEKKLNAAKIKLKEVFTEPKQKFTYIYDFGDDWFHDLTLEKITEDKLLRADCLAGKGACPPEDCGGPHGYENLKMIMNDPRDPEYKEMKEWLGLAKTQKWDADAFDLEAIRKQVAKI
ncbi:MAG: plasmid pRiA4b ORF-3 family protein [Bacteroidota bacterium]